MNEKQKREEKKKLKDDDRNENLCEMKRNEIFYLCNGNMRV